MRFPIPDPFDVVVLVLTSAALGAVIGYFAGHFYV